MRKPPFDMTRNQPSIGLGLAALGRPGYINLGHAEDLGPQRDPAEMQARASHVMSAAYEKGIRYFDAARSYGKAELFLKHWLEERPEARDVIIGSKWGYAYTADWQVDAEVHEQKEHSLRRLNQQWAETQQHLDAHVNLYQIHSATLESGVLDNIDVLNRLAEIKQTGISIGLSVSGTNQSQTILKAIEVELEGEPLFDTVQATWNLLEQSCTEALSQAHQAGMGVIIKEALANGRLTSRNLESSFRSRCQVMSDIASSLQTTLDAIAIAAVLSQPWVKIVLSGAATIEHLNSNLMAEQINLSEDDLQTLLELKEPAEQYWKTRASLNWN